MKIGVLAFQGGVIEHINQIKALGYDAVYVKKEEDLKDIDGIILPGGESTTIGKLLNITGLMDPLREKIKEGMPVWGTCAGMILLAKGIEEEKKEYLSVMNIKVRRNAYGRQISSFRTEKKIDKVTDKPIELVFIRAPFITEIGDNVEVLYKLDGNIVAARENNILVSSFHPELTKDLSFLKYFVSIIENK
ncbi:pyridoxal 5'-phosphate synthase glutaminase subunit PdxT [Clostridium sp. BJN0001]|uniref:pyridoxal 5'-phosphate synthase glutaminase subunit PdxT n=1 Tax=Clostridium sp. BJN0001 TaxID=2930219 RepID=UPI001FD00D0B|nr:pyridoxal 5'-phosphate synthase glutaminase subunit PdxT [Clostridium sp. BJN0001]